MVNTIRHFYKKYITSSPENPEMVSEHSLQIATAALLIEMMRADSEITECEWKTIAKTLQSNFGLSEEEINATTKLAEEEIRKATGYYEFTSLINNGFTHDQKVKVVEHLWKVAFSDSAS